MQLLKKAPLMAFVLGLGLIIGMSSFKSNIVSTQYGNDNGTWIPLNDLRPAADPDDLQPGEYTCIQTTEDPCTIYFEDGPGTPSSNEVYGIFTYVEPQEN